MVLKILSNMMDEEWIKTERHFFSTICIFLAYYVLFNVVEEITVKSLSEKHGRYYETKMKTNKVFLKNNFLFEDEGGFNYGRSSE